jgi:CRISPR-associated protein Csx10
MSELILTLRQPAQIGDRARDDFVLGTQEYVPGTVVRGAFAGAWLARNGVPVRGTPGRGEFLQLFEGGVRFGPLLRPGTEFLPLSVVTHKYREQQTCAEVEYDRALTGEAPLRCPDCGSPLEQVKILRGTLPPVRRRTSVSIGESGVARRGVLFTRETLEAGQEFRGTLVAADPGSLAVLAGLGPIRIGGRRTTHGLADIGIREGAGGSPLPAAQRREDGKLVIRLRSPGVFTDPQGRPSQDPDPAELTEVLGTPAQVVHRWTRWQQAGGWHVASGLPKPAELAVVPGSTYVISTERAVADAALDQLGRRGLGLRRHEGFGDLAPPPDLKPGLRARQQEARRLRELMDAVAALRGLPVRFPDRWPPLLAAMTAHADGDAAATSRLRRIAEAPPDPGTGAALRRFLEFSPRDAAYAARELARP